ncbi:hypothetical protein DFH28DRAFT_924639 [Melampsora americana]|nr:hypothetical protein DFH28DRAFT_924639 [Melampsora americana]
MVQPRKPKRDSNVLAKIGTRPSRKRKAGSPTQKPPPTNDYGVLNGDYLIDNPVAAQFIPHPEQPNTNNPPLIPIPGTQFAQESQEYWNAEDRQLEKLKSASIESDMTATYLECQHCTKNWKSQSSYLNVHITCQCPDTKLVKQMVDLYDHKDNPNKEEYPDIFIKPSGMKKNKTIHNSTETQVKNIKSACADSHTAANNVRNSTSWKRSNDTGLFGSNIYKTGEKLYYPLSILENFLMDLPEIKVGVLYDIGCQLEAHIKKLWHLRIPRVCAQLGLSSNVQSPIQ